jgi:hypothetical protein
MNRRKAIGGILGLTGISVASFVGVKYLSENEQLNKGQLKNYINLISELVNEIIPPTETPGAKEAKVQDYIIDFMESCSSKKEYENFLNGLIDLQADCFNTYGHSFENCLVDQKKEVLADLDNSLQYSSLLNKIRDRLFGRSFFNILKTLTIEGYCTSSTGATEQLAYNPIPGRYIAITKLGINQKAWATR